jgi:hypothetical protein
MASIFDAGSDVSNITNAVGTAGGDISTGLQDIGNVITGKQWAPQYNPYQMDPGSANQVSQIENGLLTTPQQNTSNILQNTGNAGAIQNQTANQNLSNQEQGGGGISGMTKAIGNKAAKNFATSQGRLNVNAQLQGQQMSNNNMSTATANAIGMQNAEYNLQSSVNNANLAANAARYQTVSSLMSGAGSFAGSYYGHQAASTPGQTYSDNGNMGNYGQEGNPDFSTGSNSSMGDYGLSSSSASGINMGDGQ